MCKGQTQTTDAWRSVESVDERETMLSLHKLTLLPTSYPYRTIQSIAMMSLSKLILIALTVLPANASQLRGDNQQFDISVESSKSKCVRETIVSLSCENGGGATSEMVDMSCDEAKKAAPGMLRDFCGQGDLKGERWSVRCDRSCDPPSGGEGGIACAWSGSGYKEVACPGTLDSKYSENYTCDNGMHICKYTTRRFLCFSCFLLLLSYVNLTPRFPYRLHDVRYGYPVHEEARLDLPQRRL